MHTSVEHSYIGYNFWSKAVLSAKLKKFGVTFIFIWNRYIPFFSMYTVNWSLEAIRLPLRPVAFFRGVGWGTEKETTLELTSLLGPFKGCDGGEPEQRW